MNLLDLILKKEKKMDDEKPEIIQDKNYRLCIEDNPDQKKYRCSNKDALSPDCKISLQISGLTHEEEMELDLEIRNMLERHDFKMR